MNPLFRPTICFTTIAALAVAAYDTGKVRTPPASGIAGLLTAASSTVSFNGAGVPNTILNAVYDTNFGRTRIGTVATLAQEHKPRNSIMALRAALVCESMYEGAGPQPRLIELATARFDGLIKSRDRA